MIIYKCAFSGDEMFSDSFPVKDLDGIAYEVTGKMVTIKDGEVDIGANPSAEGGDDEFGAGDDVRTVIDVVEAFRLQETGYDKKGFLSWAKMFCKRVKEHLDEKNPERTAEFMAKVQPFIKKVVANFNDFQFFVGESMDPEATMILCGSYGDDGMSPTFWVLKDGLDEMKV